MKWYIKINNKLSWWLAIAVGWLTRSDKCIAFVLNVCFIESEFDDNNYE